MQKIRSVDSSEEKLPQGSKDFIESPTTSVNCGRNGGEPRNCDSLLERGIPQHLSRDRPGSTTLVPLMRYLWGHWRCFMDTWGSPGHLRSLSGLAELPSQGALHQGGLSRAGTAVDGDTGGQERTEGQRGT